MQQNNAQSMPEPIEQPRVYYGYTPHVEPDGQYIVRGEVVAIKDSSARGCVAVKVDNGTIRYGVSVCSEEDNFCKEEGRRRALESLEEGFGDMVINPFYAKMESDHKRALFFLNTKIASIFKNVRAFQRKIDIVKRENVKKRSARVSM